MSVAKRLPLLGVFGIAVASVLAGCSASAHVSVGSSQVDKAEVESQVATQLAANTGQAKPDISCPSGLDAKVGATLECTLSVAGDPTKLPVHVAVDSVADGKAHFTAQVGAPAGGDKAAFCADNATLDKALNDSSGPADLLPKVKANISVIDKFGLEAPDAIKADAKVLVDASHTAIDKNDASGFLADTVAKAGNSVDTFCGVSSTTTAKP